MKAARQVVDVLVEAGEARRLISAGLGVRTKAEKIGRVVAQGQEAVFKTFELETVRPLSAFQGVKLPVMPGFFRVRRKEPSVVIGVYKFTLNPEFLMQVCGTCNWEKIRRAGQQDELLRYKIAERVVYDRRDDLSLIGIAKLHGPHLFFGVEVVGTDIPALGGKLHVGFFK